MSPVQCLFMICGVGLMLAAVGILTYDLALELRYRRAFALTEGRLPEIPKARWRTAVAFAMLGWAPILIALGLAATGIA